MAKSAPKHFFSNNPSVNTQRTLFDMSKTDTVTLNPDYYYPNFKQLVLPGDTVVLNYSNKIRLLDSLQVPMMDNLYCDTHWWFVAFDNVWDHTKNFFGEKKRPSDPDIKTLPLINFTPDTLPKVSSLYDYFGIPVQAAGTETQPNLLTGSFSVNALPMMSYYLIHDDWIRDEQRQDYLLDTPDFSATTFTPDKFKLYKRGKRFDYFTSTLLSPQVGTPTVVPLGDRASVFTSSTPVISGEQATLNFSKTDGTEWTGTNTRTLMLGSGTGNVAYSSPAGPTYSGYVYPNNLYTDLTTATPISVEHLRRAFQVQAYKEILARYGTRYTEYLYSMYGVINPDQLLGRPEFLGSTHQRLSVQPIAQTSDTSNAPLGNLGAIVQGGISEPVFTRSFTRFGYIIGCINIYSDLTYYQGLEKDWQLRDRMDFPVNVFANLTDQPVYKSEILLTGTETDNEIFGYNEIYSWAKFAQNSLRGLVRPNVSGSVGYWSLAETFNSVPVNNDKFIESTTPIDRITAVDSSDNVHHFICNQMFGIKLTRELPMHSDPMRWMFRY